MTSNAFSKVTLKPRPPWKVTGRWLSTGSDGQFAQPPDIYSTLPDNRSGLPGLFFAAEFTEASSQNAAMISGEKTAKLILKA